MACPYVPVDAGYLQAMLAFIDCQALTIGQQGYLALAAPGSVASIALTGLMTIMVALMGYRLLLGDVPTMRDGVLTLVKIGVVLALATGWDAYRVLVYDMALRSPGEFASSISLSAGLPGSGALVAHLGTVDQQLQALAAAGTGPPVNYQQQGIAPPLFAGFDTFALGTARVGFLIGTLGAFAATRLAAGILLALGPLFIAFLLFDATRGLFAGWLRALGGMALGAMATMIMLGLEVSFLEPWLTELVARRGADQPIPGVPAELLAVTIIFLVALVAVVIVIARVTWGFRLPERLPGLFRDSSRVETASSISSAFNTGTRSIQAGERSRAAAVVEALAAAERRELGPHYAGDTTTRFAGGAMSAVGRGPTSEAAASATTSRDASRRRNAARVSASAERRDRR